MSFLTVPGELSRINLKFIAEGRQDEFIDHVFRSYELAAKHEVKHTKSGYTYSEIPDIVEDIAYVSHDLYVVSAVIFEEGDPGAFEKRLKEAKDEEDAIAIIDSLMDEYMDDSYSNLYDMYIGDIAEVCEFYNMSYIYTWSDPFNPINRYYEMKNHPIIEVW